MTTLELIERRADIAALLVLVQQMHADMQIFSRRLDEQRHEDSLALAASVVALTLKAFPEGDADGHKKAHEAQMAAVEARAEFWKKMLFEVTKYGVLGVLGWLAVKIWLAFLDGPTR